MKRVLILFLFFFFFLSFQNPKILLAADSNCYETVKTLNVNITNYSPNLTSNTCDSSTGGGAGTADGSGSFQTNNGRLRWVKSDGSGAEDYVFAEPTDNSVISWNDRENYGIVIPGFNSNKPILIRDHYATGNHLGQMYLDLFVPCSEWGSAPTGNHSVQIVDLKKPISSYSTSCSITTTNSLTIGNPLTAGIEALLRWFFGLFNKTDYTIDQRSYNEIGTDTSDYGNLNDKSAFKEKHAFAGSRISSDQDQICFKGTVMKKVATGEDSNNPEVSKIYINNDNSCQLKINQSSNNPISVTMKDLIFYFIQSNKQFYCDDNNKNLINTDQSIVNKIKGIGLTNPDKSPAPTPTPIPNNLLTCYQYVYDDLYLTPKETSSEDENTKKMIQIAIPADKQNPNADSNTLKDNLNKNFSPEGTSWGLNGLRPYEPTPSQSNNI
jgi:hypothetical protein